ncbi:hypothetical protein B0A53_01248 [Rhodotorula sp. CCFEE 5036]|nr:hypothetical protein B0A53_01248 [Rhodotorula sp. CCFEE 5036]
MLAATTDGSLLTCLLISACALSGITTGLLLPAIAIPALFAAPLSARGRLHVWSRLEAESSSLVGSLLPLLSGSLALCALLARSAESDATAPALGGGEGWICGFLVTVAQNRRSLFVLAAILTLALRPYSFGLLTPRIEALEAEERRLLLLGLRARNSSRGTTITGLDRALGRSGWRGASPTLEEQEKSVDEKGNENGNGNGNGNGNESDEEDNGFDSEDLSEGDESELQAGVAKVRDTDRLILELSRLQLGPAILCGAAFALTVLDLACA